jgi:hypothetical protein
MESMLDLMEMFVVLGFAVGWGILELYTLRLDKRRREQTGTERNGNQPPAAS